MLLIKVFSLYQFSPWPTIHKEQSFLKLGNLPLQVFGSVFVINVLSC